MDWLEQYQGHVVLSVLAAAIVTLAVAEMLFPKRRDPDNLGYRWVNNIGLATVSLFCNRLYYTALGLTGAWFASRHEFGLFAQIDAPWLLVFLVALLLFNFIDYWMHRAMHTFPILWRLHAVHHSDTAFDITTTYRNHPFAAMITLSARLPFVLLLGTPISVIAAYDALRVAQDLWSHSNTGLPPALDRWLRLVVVTPDFHRVHHCSQREFTDSNYGSTLPWFDYLFGTYRNRLAEEQVDMEIGLEYLRDPGDTRLDRMLLMPLRSEFATAGASPSPPEHGASTT